ncbi:MAG: hypothetical protein ACI87E_003370 [Mariniblastus sp.]|jgi:hypothetical protein
MCARFVQMPSEKGSFPGRRDRNQLNGSLETAAEDGTYSFR